MINRRPVRLCMALTAMAVVLPACVPNRPSPAAPPAPVWQPEPEKLGEAPELLEERVTAPARDILGGLSYDLPLKENSWVEAELDFLVNQRREVIGRWLERGDIYEAFVKEELRRQEIPTDLYPLAMIESGFIPRARSRAGAVGFWQFMPATGRAMGLRIDATVDERMDPVRSTRAAARHLRDLRRAMGDWELAAAAYNAGQGRISRGLQAYQASDFWDLAERGDLADETRHYVPRLYAMTVIARGRDRFGFQRVDAGPFAFDSIHVELATPLDELGRIANLPAEELQRLNPHLLRGITPEGGYWVWVPASRGPDIQRAYLASDFRRDRGLGTYVVRPGDYLGRLAERSGIRMARIQELNPEVSFHPLLVGARLRLPREAVERLADHGERAEAALASNSAPAATAAPAPAAAPTPKSDEVRVHAVRPGETLWQIARDNGTTVEALQRSNGLNGSTIRPGMELTLPVAESVSQEEAPRTAEHVVASGDTLWGIARRYGTSVQAIRDANELGERPIRPGQKLSVPL